MGLIPKLLCAYFCRKEIRFNEEEGKKCITEKTKETETQGVVQEMRDQRHVDVADNEEEVEDVDTVIEKCENTAVKEVEKLKLLLSQQQAESEEEEELEENKVAAAVVKLEEDDMGFEEETCCLLE